MPAAPAVEDYEYKRPQAKLQQWKGGLKLFAAWLFCAFTA
jgi:hypothetical protein